MTWLIIILALQSPGEKGLVSLLTVYLFVRVCGISFSALPLVMRGGLQFLLVTLTEDLFIVSFEPRRDKTNKLTCAPSEDSDQTGHPPSLIRVFAVRSVGS